MLAVAGLGCKRSSDDAVPPAVGPAPAVEVRYVLASVAVVRAAPDPGAEAVARWPIGTRVVVAGRQDRFIRVDQDGVRGFLFEGLLSETEPKLAALIASYDKAPEGAFEERRTWAERAAALAPDDEGAVRRLVDVLDRLGDRKALLRARRGLETILAAKAAEAAASTQTASTSIARFQGPGRACLAASPRRDVQVRFDHNSPVISGSVDEESQGCSEPEGCSYWLQVVGEVTGTSCTGARLVVLQTEEGGCLCKCDEADAIVPTTLRFLDLGDAWVPVMHREEAPRWALQALGKIVVTEEHVTVAGLSLDAPDEIDLGDRKRLRRAWDGLRFENKPGGSVVKAAGGHQLYADGARFMLPRPDGTVVSYERLIPEREEGISTEDIDFDVAKTSTQARVATRYVFHDGVASLPKLVPVGRVRETKDELYTYALAEDAQWDERYANYAAATEQYRQVYGKEREQLSKRSFIDRIPLLLWADPFGEYHVFIREDLVVPEMAEPLVYLYAPQPTRVRIDVGENVELIAADPPYEAGWSVRTRADGQLDDLSSGRVISSVFWEGRSSLLPEPRTGFVVAADEVRGKLEEVLPKLGLAAREVTDFVEYWAPRLQAAPYYRLSFLDPRLVDRMAPLLLSPAPDVSVRVHMDAKPLARREKIAAPSFAPVPERRGLVLVEWSGFRRAQPSVPYYARNSPAMCLPRR